MTTTAVHSTLGQGRSVSRRHYSRTSDRLIARFGVSMLRWAGERNRRRTLTAEAHATLRAVDAERAQRELAAQQLGAMRGF